MRYIAAHRSLFEFNRQKFTTKMKPNTLAVFNSNDIYPKGSADGTITFKQHPDFYYLSGVDQEESILVLFPDCVEPKHREVLFLRKTNEHIAIWEGEKLSKDRAFEVSGIKTVYWLEEFDRVFNEMMTLSQGGIYLNTNEHLRFKNNVETRDDRFRKKVTVDYPLHTLLRAAPIMHEIRALKHPQEIELMQEACNITEKGFRRVLGYVKPGVNEFEIQAEITHEFLMNRADGFAYDPIIASGANACVLHYTQNNKPCKDGDLILMDFGAEYAHYDSDLTRCIPVSGKFSSRQKQVYNAVLRVKREAEKLLTPGTLLKDYHLEVGKIMTSELLGLGLIDKTDVANEDPAWPAYKRYFMHGTSHFLGIDTHDVGHWHQPIQAGMVFTCEPGIYIQEEGLGIRLEDDLLVTDNVPFNLMRNIPIEVEEIETLMNG